MNRYCCILIFILCTLATVAQKTNHLTPHQGLAGETVYDIFYDKYGVMWFGTSNGLTSFNGVNINNFRLNDLLSENGIIGITQTEDGRYMPSPTSMCSVWWRVNRGLSRQCRK